MKIEDCKTVPEFFGVEEDAYIWIEGEMFLVWEYYISGRDTTLQEDGQALVGCLTGQLKWSTTEPMTADEEKLLREIAAWFPWWEKLYLSKTKTIQVEDDFEVRIAFDDNSKAYEVLTPILEKYGEINLDDYRR